MTLEEHAFSAITGKEFFNLTFNVEGLRVPSPDDPTVAIDQEGGRHLVDREIAIGGRTRFGVFLGDQRCLTSVRPFCRT